MMEKAVQLVQKEASIWASLSLLALFAIGAKTGITLDLLVVAIAGFYFSARLQIRGFCYALILLLVDAAARHTLLVHDHLFQLGLECSLGSTFFITALSFEQGTNQIDTLATQLSTKETALSNLEEDFTKAQAESLAQQMAFQERLVLLQKELEELQTEHSSILILNEVLRKTSARFDAENASLSTRLLNADRLNTQLKGEYQFVEEELLRIKDASTLAQTNTQLTDELNQARFDKAQTHLINETLARLYLKESLKAKDADKEAADLSAQLDYARKQVVPAEDTAPLKAKIEELTASLQAAKEEAARLTVQLSEVPAPQVVETIDASAKEQLDLAYKQINKLKLFEPQLRQLRQQFDEKNKVLHQVRSELFKTDTELQKLKLEKAALELHPLPKEVEKELGELSSELLALEEENRELQELVTILNESPEVAEKRKKKVKIQPQPKDESQEFLF